MNCDHGSQGTLLCYRARLTMKALVRGSDIFGISLSLGETEPRSAGGLFSLVSMSGCQVTVWGEVPYAH